MDVKTIVTILKNHSSNFQKNLLYEKFEKKPL